VKNSILNISVSGFKNVKATTEPKPVNLLTWLHSDKYRPAVDKIRILARQEEAATTDQERKRLEAERKALKIKLPCITPSGEFNQRNEAGLVRRTGLMCLDIDKKDNTHISNYSDLKQQLANITNFAYVGYSVSGNGFFCLVPIAEPDKHKLHFEALKNDMAEFGIILDNAGSDITRLRFYSYDNEAYFNHQAEVYSKIYQKPAKVPKVPRVPRVPGKNNFEKLFQLITTTGTDITGNYNQWFEIGCSLANEFGASGLDYYHDISRFSQKYDSKTTDIQFKQCLKYGYNFNLDTFFYYAKLAGVTLDKTHNFTTPPPVKVPKVPKVPPVTQTIEELNKYFDSVQLPEPPVKLDGHTTITDTRQFINSHIQTYCSIKNEIYRRPYLDRLKQLAEIKKASDSQRN
jgi:hypothetical protein